MSSSGVCRVLGIALVIGVFFSVPYVNAGWFDKKPAQEPPKPAPKEQPKPAPAPVTKTSAPPSQGPKVVSEITWSEVRNKFIKKDSDLTSAQKDKLERDRKNWWNESYRSKWVRWKGSVQNVRSGGGSVSIDMGEGSWGSDIILQVDPAARDKAAELNKGSYVTFVGRMNEQPGSIAAMELLEVTIE